jgi:hypothetical protein
MAKFRVRMKLSGLELEIDGSREDMPIIANSLGKQLSGLLQPSAQIVDGEVVSEAPLMPAAQPQDDSTKRRRGRRRGVPPASGGGSTASGENTLDWRHDPTKYGSPKQEWTTSDKILWTLYVAGEETGTREMNGGQLTRTFNKHFRQAGQLQRQNVYRDLGKLKTGRKGELPLVSENTTASPTTWFLTEAGTKAAQQLVLSALAPT